jgi:hypothetical protein
MIRYKVIATFSVAVILVGCAQNLWVKPLATQSDFERDRYSCLQDSQQRVGAAQVNVYGGSAINTMTTNEMLFNSCMGAKGWSLKSKDVIQAEVAQNQAKDSVVRDTISSVVERVKIHCRENEFKEYYAKTGCLVSDISFSQIADESKITPEQKVALLKQQDIIAGFNKEQDEIMKRAGAAGVREADLRRIHLYPMQEKNNLNLFTGKITWGEYNQRRRDIPVEFRKILQSNW